MSKPTVNEQIGCYELDWEDEQINIKVTRIRPHSDGTVKGQIFVTTTAPGFSPFLHQSIFNFSSAQTMNSFAKKMQERFPSAKWEELTEQMCYFVQNFVRRGEPVNEIWAMDEQVRPPEFILEPLMLRGLPTVIYGEKGSCKSTLAMVLATCLHLPWQDNLLGFKVSSKSEQTLILDWEQNQDIVQWQLNCLRKGMELPEYPLLYRRCTASLVDDIEQIQQHILETKAKVIIIDSLAPACGGELKDASQALSFFNNLRKLQVTTLIIGQTSKDKENHKTIFGSVFFQYLARSIWELRKVQDAGDNVIELGLYHRDGNYTGKYDALGFRVTRDSNSMTISKQSVRNVSGLIEGLTTRDRILDLLKDGAMGNSEISEFLGITKANADTTLVRLRDKRLIIKVGDKWGLPY